MEITFASEINKFVQNLDGNSFIENKQSVEKKFANNIGKIKIQLY